MANYLDTSGLTYFYNKLKAKFATKAEVGSPLTASTVAGMTDTSKVYVYTGSETGYTAGDWYYYDGTSWTDGGTYNSTAFETDKTLAVGDMAADAEVVGDELTDLKSAIDNIDTAVFESKTKEQSVHITGTSIPGSTVIISDVNISEGSKYTLTISDPDGIINPNNSNVKNITVYRVDSDSQKESIGAVVIDEPKQFTASVDIIGFTIYKGANSVTPPGDLVCECIYETADGQNSIQYRLNNVESRLDDTDEYLSDIIDNTLTESNKAADAKVTGDELRELETIVAGSDAINYVEDKRIDNDGSLVTAPGVCVSEKITYDWTGYRRYYCNDNSVKSGYEIAFYDSNDVMLGIFKSPSAAGGSLFRAIDAETQVTGTPAYVRFSFKKGTVGKIEESSNVSPVTFWFAQTIHTNGIAEEIDRMISAYVGSNSATISEDSLSSGTSLILDSAPWFIKKNVGITATMKFNSFTDVTIGKGYENYRGRWIKVDGTNITPYYYNGTETVAGDSIPHSLTISNFLNVSMYMAADGNCRVSLNSMTGTFSTQIDFAYEWNYAPFVFGSQVMTDVKLNYSCADLRCPLWLFGDSYMGVAVNRIAGQLKNIGYFNICIDAIAGGRSIDSGTPGKSIYDDFLRMLTFARPKFVIWTLGMNGGDAMNVNFLPTLIEKCEAENIELILYIAPNVPEYNHDTLNAYIKSLNIRYIDGYDAVGANAQGEWYGHGTANDYLSSDDIHPSSLGAKALAMRFIIDVPEIVQYGYTTGSVDGEIDGDEH